MSEMILQLREAVGNGRGWIKFLGYVSFISGILFCITIIGAIIGWLPIWLGRILLRVSAKADRILQEENEDALVEYLQELAHWFRISGILTIIYLGLVVLGIVGGVVAMAIFGFSAMPKP